MRPGLYSAAAACAAVAALTFTLGTPQSTPQSGPGRPSPVTVAVVPVASQSSTAAAIEEMKRVQRENVRQQQKVSWFARARDAIKRAARIG